jgi:hypothetical protein
MGKEARRRSVIGGGPKSKGSAPAASPNKYFQQCAKENSLDFVPRVKSRANGEGRERGPCNQGWGLGILFLPRHHVRWIDDV